jgi:hypothetical protein
MRILGIIGRLQIAVRSAAQTSFFGFMRWFAQNDEPRTIGINRLYRLSRERYRRFDQSCESWAIEPIAQKQRQPRTDRRFRRVIRGCIVYPVGGSGDL